MMSRSNVDSMKKGFLMRLQNKNNGVSESKERKKNNLGKIFNRDEYQQIIFGGLFWSRVTFAYRGSEMFLGIFGKHWYAVAILKG